MKFWGTFSGKPACYTMNVSQKPQIFWELSSKMFAEAVAYLVRSALGLCREGGDSGGAEIFGNKPTAP